MSNFSFAALSSGAAQPTSTAGQFSFAASPFGAAGPSSFAEQLQRDPGYLAARRQEEQEQQLAAAAPAPQRESRGRACKGKKPLQFTFDAEHGYGDNHLPDDQVSDVASSEVRACTRHNQSLGGYASSHASDNSAAEDVPEPDSDFDIAAAEAEEDEVSDSASLSGSAIEDEGEEPTTEDEEDYDEEEDDEDYDSEESEEKAPKAKAKARAKPKAATAGQQCPARTPVTAPAWTAPGSESADVRQRIDGLHIYGQAAPPATTWSFRP